MLSSKTVALQEPNSYFTLFARIYVQKKKKDFCKSCDVTKYVDRWFRLAILPWNVSLLVPLKHGISS